MRDVPPTLENRNVTTLTPLLAPAALQSRLPLDAVSARFIARTRVSIANIIAGRDPRFIVVVGPCSIHDLVAAREYLSRLLPLAAALADRILVVMRVYFEKPRSTVGWKGLINDPHLNGSFDIESGLSLARSFLLELVAARMPAASEALDPIVPQYLGDLISWYAIGARTTESQTHREMASGLSAPCGFKNGTDGAIAVALQAIEAARSPHHFLGIDADGRTAIVCTRGNHAVHVILRGGRAPNYDAEAVQSCVEALRSAGQREAVMVDCSHGNSGKDPARQAEVARAVLAQRQAGQKALIGIMLESHLEWGNQALTGGPDGLRYGVSITDACMNWETTANLLQEIHARLV